MAGLSSLVADLVSGPSVFHYDLPGPHLTNSTNVKYVLQNVYVSNTVVLSFSLQLGYLTYKELFPHLLLLCVDSENGCLSPFTGILNDKMQTNLAFNRNSRQNSSENFFSQKEKKIFKGAII